MNLKELEKYSNQIEVLKLLTKYPRANAYLSLKANTLDMTVLVNKDTAEIIQIVDLRPWK